MTHGRVSLLFMATRYSFQDRGSPPSDSFFLARVMVYLSLMPLSPLEFNYRKTATTPWHDYVFDTTLPYILERFERFGCRDDDIAFAVTTRSKYRELASAKNSQRDEIERTVE